jgi:predicted glycoside hydrolase/deacetylase ChbG (UPF0249 family)
MAGGAAFVDAVAIAKQRPALGVGCHIVLVDGTPASPASEIPTLLGPDGKNFRPSLINFVRDLLLGLIKEDEIEREAIAQIQKLQNAGLTVTHLDTHKHTHIFLRVLRPLLRAAAQCGIGCIRNPFEERWSKRLSDTRWLRMLEVSGLRPLRKYFQNQPAIRNSTILTSNGSVGIAVTGTLNAAALRRIFEKMPPGTWELVCHPGYNNADLDRIQTRLRGSRETERSALLAEIPQLVKNHPEIELIHYGDLCRTENAKIIAADGKCL